MASRFEFTYTDFSGDENACADNAFVRRTFEGDSLEKVLDEFLQFLWNCTFSYVEQVEAHCENGPSISSTL